MVADATRDHDVPRPCPPTPRNLADVVYVANLLAGGTFEWLLGDNDAAADSNAEIGEAYQALLPEIDTREQEMRSVFG
jgi:hypothetical protein